MRGLTPLLWKQVVETGFKYRPADLLLDFEKVLSDATPELRKHILNKHFNTSKKFKQPDGGPLWEVRRMAHDAPISFLEKTPDLKLKGAFRFDVDHANSAVIFQSKVDGRELYSNLRESGDIIAYFKYIDSLAQNMLGEADAIGKFAIPKNARNTKQKVIDDLRNIRGEPADVLQLLDERIDDSLEF